MGVDYGKMARYRCILVGVLRAGHMGACWEYGKMAHCITCAFVLAFVLGLEVSWINPLTTHDASRHDWNDD